MKRQSQAVIPLFSETEMAQFQIRFEEYFPSCAVEILISPCTSVETNFHQTKSSAWVLTSSETLQIIEAKEREKREKQVLKEKRKREREDVIERYSVIGFLV